MSDLSTLGHIVSDTLTGKVTLSQAWTEAETLGAHVVSELGPAGKVATQVAVDAVKSAAATGLGIASADLAPAMAVAATAVEGAVDTLMITATKGAATGLVPVANAGMDMLEKQLQAAISAKFLAWRAALTQSAPTVAATDAG